MTAMLALLVKGKQLVLALLVLTGTGGLFWSAQKPAAEPLTLEGPAPAIVATVAATSTPAPIVVFVSGAVKEPGVYTLPPNSRVVDALHAAGGPTEQAAIASLNQATLLSDGVQVHMPEEGEAALPAALAPTSATSFTAAPSSEPLVRLNSADSTALESLPGIGPAIAARIIEYRTANGPFTSVEQLKDVHGIGDKLLEKIRDRIVLE